MLATLKGVASCAPVLPKYRIYLSPPSLSGAERGLLDEVLQSGWLAPAGPMLARFEQQVAARCGVEHAVAVSSGTAALHLALRAVGVGPGDEVLCATFSFVAGANPCLYLGAKPVFIDSDERTWNADPALVARAIRERAAVGRLPKALLVADIYGQCFDADPIMAVAREYGVPVVEDAAEAFGATYKGRSAGGLGDIGVLSFNGNKIVTTSGGGMVLSNNKQWVDNCHFWATQAREPGLAYTHTHLGYNYRMSNVLAALGIAQLPELEARVTRRRALFARYKEALDGVAGMRFMPEPEGYVSTRWLSCLTFEGEGGDVVARRVCEGLLEDGIEGRPLWLPLHEQKVFGETEVYGGAVASRLGSCGLSLPSGSSLADAEVDDVIASVRRHCDRARP
jgi:dTDP-4-amino-4,6-dideoxygalactose transaminase